MLMHIPLQVYPMYKAYIEPDLQTAQIKIINKFNPFTGFQSPTYILKVSSKITHYFNSSCVKERKKIVGSDAVLMKISNQFYNLF